MAVARRAILVVKALVVLIGSLLRYWLLLLLLRRGWGPRTPLRLLLVWDDVVVIGLGLIAVTRREHLVIDWFYARVGRVIGLGGIDSLDE